MEIRLLIKVIFLFLIARTSYAEQNKAVDWLISQQSTDGAIYLDTDIANSEQSTYEAILALQLSQATSSQIERAKLFFINLEPENASTKNLALKLLNVQESSTDFVNSLNELKSRQNQDGSFGFVKNIEQSSIIDTAFALLALSKVGDAEAVDLSIQFLLSRQNSDGSWGVEDHDDHKFYTTYHAINSISEFSTNIDVAVALKKAKTFFKSKRDSQNHWGNDYHNSLALLSLLPMSNDASDYKTVLSTLVETQKVDGSWEGDVYKTALAARVVALAKTFSDQEPKDSATLKGAVQNTTGQNLSNVSIALINSEGQILNAVQSSSEGQYYFEKVQKGSFVLRYALDGFYSVERAVAVDDFGIINLGSTQLIPADGVVFGKVVDAKSGQPIKDTRLSFETSGLSQVVVSNDLGEYYANLKSGDYQISITAQGYKPVNASTTISQGMKIEFSPKLIEEDDTAPPVTQVELIGVVRDKDSQQLIQGASIEIVDQAVTSTTDDSGKFSITEVNPGSAKLVISKQGYYKTIYDLIIPESKVVDLGSLSLTVQSLPNLSTISGEVYSEQSTPLQDVSLTLMPSNVSTQTNTKGEFLLSAVSEGEYQVKLSKQGYYDQVFNVVVPKGKQLILPRLTMNKKPVTLAATVIGVVTSDSGVPVVGAVVKLSGLDKSAITDANGQYKIENVSNSNFQIFVKKEGYWSANVSVQMERVEDINVDIVLDKISQLGVEISSFTTQDNSFSAYSPVVFNTKISNKSDSPTQVRTVLSVKDSNGKTIDSLVSDQEKNNGAGKLGEINLGKKSEAELTTQWFTGISSPGNYIAEIKVFEKSTNRLLVQDSLGFTIEATKKINFLSIKVDPEFANVGEEFSLNFQLSAENRSNVEHELNISYQLSKPNSQQLIDKTTVLKIDPNKPIEEIALEEFQYLFDESGMYPINLSVIEQNIVDEIKNTEINVAPSIRIEIEQDLSPTIITPDKDKKLKIGIKVEGVER